MAKSKKKKILTPEQAIIAKCVECSGGVKPEVEFCCVLDCPLWPYRNGLSNKEMPMTAASKAIWDEDIEVED